MMEREADEKIPIGTKKPELERFFKEHQMVFGIGDGSAEGHIYTEGCGPFGCGTDAAIISISVRIDEKGTVVADPRMVAIYTDCL
jgi:RecA/RadA recombinase